MIPTKLLTVALGLTLTVLLGSAGMSWSANLQKGLDAINLAVAPPPPPENPPAAL